MSWLSGLIAPDPRLDRMLAFNSEREGIIEETVRRVVHDRLRLARALSTSAEQRRALELMLNEVCFHEEQRLRASRKPDDDERALRSRFRRIQRGLRRMSEKEIRRSLGDLTRWYARDIVGNFTPSVYAFATRAAPVGLSVLFSPVRLGRTPEDLSRLRERVRIEGPVGSLARLAKDATLVVVPTHLSNLDSIVVGFALDRSGLPPCTYGAGKNLFTNPVLSFLMRNVGAYRVDRRIKHDLYKEVLKSYSTVLLERGHHSLFFPGGTRSRSGALESKLKLGLLGTALEATIGLRARGDLRPIYIVPATLNYHLVLEAGTLIDDFLKESGKSRYIIDDDESTKVSRVARYLYNVVRSEASMTIEFGEPLDVLGNRVSPEGTSLDDRGRAVALDPYLTIGTRIQHEPRRDAEYTRQLGERIIDSFRTTTHALSTHLVAFAAFRLLVRRAVPTADLFQVLRGGELTEPLPLGALVGAIGRVRDELKRLSGIGRVRLGGRIAAAAPDALLSEAIDLFAQFYSKPVIRRSADFVTVEDRPVCYYYHNRLATYGLEEFA